MHHINFPETQLELNPSAEQDIYNPISWAPQ